MRLKETTVQVSWITYLHVASLYVIISRHFETEGEIKLSTHDLANNNIYENLMWRLIFSTLRHQPLILLCKVLLGKYYTGLA